MSTYHINLAFVLFDPCAHQESEEQLVLLKQRSAHVAVEAEGEVVVDVLYSLCNVITLWNEEG